MADFNHYQTNEQSFTLLDVEKEFKENKNYVTFPDSIADRLLQDKTLKEYNYHEKDVSVTMSAKEINCPQNSSVNFKKVLEDLENGSFFGNITEEERKNLGIEEALETLKEETTKHLLKYKMALFSFNLLLNFFYGCNNRIELKAYQEITPTTLGLKFSNDALETIRDEMPINTLIENVYNRQIISFINLYYSADSDLVDIKSMKETFTKCLEKVLISTEMKYSELVKFAFEHQEVLSFFIVEIMDIVASCYSDWSDDTPEYKMSCLYSQNFVLGFLINSPCITMQDFLHIFFEDTVIEKMKYIRIEIDIYAMYITESIIDSKVNKIKGYNVNLSEFQKELDKKLDNDRTINFIYRCVLLLQQEFMYDLSRSNCLNAFIESVSISELEPHVRMKLKKTMDNVLTIHKMIRTDVTFNEVLEGVDGLQNSEEEDDEDDDDEEQDEDDNEEDDDNNIEDDEYDYGSIFKFIDMCEKLKVNVYHKFERWDKESAQLDYDQIKDRMVGSYGFWPVIKVKEGIQNISDLIETQIRNAKNNYDELFSDNTLGKVISEILKILPNLIEEEDIKKKIGGCLKDLFSLMGKTIRAYVHAFPPSMIKLCNTVLQWKVDEMEDVSRLETGLVQMITQSRNYEKLELLKKFEGLYKFKKPKIEFIELPVSAREEIFDDDSEDNFNVENFENTAKPSEIIEIIDDEDELSWESIHSQKESRYRIPNNPTLLDDPEFFEEEKENIIDYDDHVSVLENNEEHMSESENDENMLHVLENEDPYEYWYNTLEIKMLEVLDLNNETVEDGVFVDHCSKFDMIYIMTRLFEDNCYKLKYNTLFREYFLFSITSDLKEGNDYTKLNEWWRRNENRNELRIFERKYCPPASKYFPEVYDFVCNTDLKSESRKKYYDEMKRVFANNDINEAMLIVMVKSYRQSMFQLMERMLLDYNVSCRLLSNGNNLLLGIQLLNRSLDNHYDIFRLEENINESLKTNDLMKIVYLLKIEKEENPNYDFYYEFKPNYHMYQGWSAHFVNSSKKELTFQKINTTIPVFRVKHPSEQNPFTPAKSSIYKANVAMVAFEMYSLHDIKFWEYFTPNMRVVYGFIFVFMKNMSLDFLHREQINGNVNYDEWLGDYRPKNLPNGWTYSILTEDWSLEQVEFPGQGVVDNREDNREDNILGKLFFEQINFNIPFYRRDRKIDNATKTYRTEYLRPVDETKLHFKENLIPSENDNQEASETKEEQRTKIKSWIKTVPLPAMENMYGVFAKRKISSNTYGEFEDRELESLITVFSRDDPSIVDFDNFIINLLFDFRYRTDAYFQTETINGMMDVCLDCYIEIIVQRDTVDDKLGNVKQFHVERRQLLQFSIDMIFPDWAAYDALYQKFQPLRVAGRLPPVISWEKVFIILKIKDQLHPSAHRNYTGYLLPYYIEPKNEMGEQRFHEGFLNEIEKYGIFTRDKLEKDTKGCFIRSLEKCLEMKNQLTEENKEIINTIKSRLITGGVSKKNFERICQEFKIELTFVNNKLKYTNQKMHTQFQKFGKNIQGPPRFSCELALFQDTEYGISHYLPFVEHTSISNFYLEHQEECEKLYPSHQFRGPVQPIYRMSQITDDKRMKFDKNAVGVSSLQLIEKMVLSQKVKRVFNFDFYKVSPQIAQKLPTTLPLISPEDYRIMEREKPEWQKNRKRTRSNMNNENIDQINELNITTRVNLIENENEDDDIDNEFIINEEEFASKENPKQMDPKFIFFADTETIINEEIHKTYLACAISYDEKKSFTAVGDNAAKTLLIQIAQYCDSIEEKNKNHPPVTIYFHNLGYDSRVIEDVIITSSIEKNAKIYCEKIILRYSPAINVTNGELPRKNISQKSKIFLLKDTLGVIPFPLKSFSSVFKLEGDNEKEYMPYNLYTKENIAGETLPKEEFFRDLKCENKEAEIARRMEKSGSECLDENRIKIVEYAKYYCMQDVKILRNGFIKYQKMMLDTLNIDIVRHCTISGIAYTYFRDKCFYQVGRLDFPIYEYTGAVRDYIRNCIVGGRCMVSAYYNNRGCVIGRPWTDEKRIVDYDACSLYPSAVGRLLLPTGHPHNILKSNWLKKDINGEIIPDAKKIVDQFVPEQEQPNVGKKITAFIGKIRITDYDKETTYPFPLFRVKNEKGSNEYTNDPKLPLEMYVDNITLEDLIKYHKIKFEIVEGMYWTGTKCDRFSKEMKKVYDKRRELKSKGDPNEIVYKLIMNSCYGKTIQKPIIEEIVFKHPGKNDEEDQYIENYEIKNYGIIKEKVAIDEKNIKYKVFREIDEIFSPSLIGVLILSMSKRIMNEVMCLMKNGSIEVEENGMTTIVPAEAFYQDTDSIHMTYETMVALEKAFKQNYGRDLRGSQMGQFHPDFPQINGKDTRSVASIFLGKKAYCDILRIDDPLTEEDKHKYKAFVRLKGIPEENIIQTANDMNMNIYDFYYHMAQGNPVDYDLLATRVRFKMRKDYKVSTVEEFRRKVQFPVACGLDCYENDENGIHVPLKLNLNEKPEGMN